MFIIGFSPNTSIKWVNIICRHLKHCAVIIPNKQNYIMYQFVKYGNVSRIAMNKKSLSYLKNMGWKFVYIHKKIPKRFTVQYAISCVDLAKRALNMHALFIQTPNSLYQYLCKKKMI
ncbi:MAG: hypothetical protein ACLRFI_03355 [Alphaproteobacteria bacterium]